MRARPGVDRRLDVDAEGALRRDERLGARDRRGGVAADEERGERAQGERAEQRQALPQADTTDLDDAEHFTGTGVSASALVRPRVEVGVVTDPARVRVDADDGRQGRRGACRRAGRRP